MEHRPYQQKLVDELSSKLKPRYRVKFQLPTGAGKSWIAIQVAQRWVGDYPILKNVVWLTFGDELEEQSYARLVEAGLGAALVTSPIKLYNAMRRGDHSPSEYTLLIVDESHHATANTWKRVITEWPGPVLGLTATPWRLSRKEGFDQLFHELVIGPSTQELIDQKYLVPCRVRIPIGDTIEGIGRSQGDFSMGQTWEKGDKTLLVKMGIQWLLKERSPHSRTLCYCTTVQHAKNVHQYALHMGLRSALMLGETPKHERREVVRKLDLNELDLVVNVEVVTEGCDFPGVDSILMLRPTESLALWLQMAGRAMRPYEGKEYALILDATPNWEKHGLPEEDRDWTLGKRSKKTRGEAPTHLCKSINKSTGHICHTINHISARQCVECGSPFGHVCVGCGNFIYGISKGAKCPRCNEAAQQRKFRGGVSTIIPAEPAYLRREKKLGIYIAGEPQKEGTVVLISPKKTNKRWKESITRMVARRGDGYLYETKRY